MAFSNSYYIAPLGSKESFGRKKSAVGRGCWAVTPSINSHELHKGKNQNTCSLNTSFCFLLSCAMGFVCKSQQACSRGGVLAMCFHYQLHCLRSKLIPWTQGYFSILGFGLLKNWYYHQRIKQASGSTICHISLPKAKSFEKHNEIYFPHPKKTLYPPLLPTTTAGVQEHFRDILVSPIALTKVILHMSHQCNTKKHSPLLCYWKFFSALPPDWQSDNLELYNPQ